MQVKKILLWMAIAASAFSIGWVVRSCNMPDDSELIASLERQVLGATQIIKEKETENLRLFSENVIMQQQIDGLQSSAETAEVYTSSLTGELEQLRKNELKIKDKDLLITNLRLQNSTQEERYWSAVDEIQSLKAIITFKDSQMSNLNKAYINRGLALDAAVAAMNAGLVTSKKLAAENKSLKEIIKYGGIGIGAYASYKLILQPILR
jgi:hypothetical protein